MGRGSSDVHERARRDRLWGGKGRPRAMTRACAAALALLLLVPVAATAGDPDEEEWIPLFNGRDLEGWVPNQLELTIARQT